MRDIPASLSNDLPSSLDLQQNLSQLSVADNYLEDYKHLHSKGEDWTTLQYHQKFTISAIKIVSFVAQETLKFCNISNISNIYFAILL